MSQRPAPTFASLLADGWREVVFSAQVDPDTDECHGDYTDCPCPGPTMDDHEYIEANGKVLARLKKRFPAK